MQKMIFALLVALFMLLGGVVVANTAKTAGSPDRVLLQWTSQQQMNWDVRIKAQGFRLLAAPLAALDVGGKQKATVAPDGGSLAFESATSWSTGLAVVQIEPGKSGTLRIDIRDPYVKDRHTTAQFTLADLQQGRVITIHSKEWPIRNCTLRLTIRPDEVEQEARLVNALGADRKSNIDALLSAADKAASKARRTDLLLRAAAACTGGCNHGPLQPDGLIANRLRGRCQPDGWDRAIAIYQKVIDENKGSDLALDAMWAQASCCACWSPQPGCDKDGRGKGDWKSAIKLYEKLHQVSSSPSDKADALRRVAEIQCFVGDDWDAALRNYRKIAEDYPGSLPPSTHWTYRTCAPHCGTDQLAWDIYRAMVYNASDSRGVGSMFDEYFGKVKGNPYVDELALLVNRKGGQMEPKIITKNEIILVGSTSDGSDIHGLWVKYEEQEKSIKHKVDGTCYEWHDWNAHKCMVATEVTQVDAISEGMSVMRLPAGQYAVFTHRLANGGYAGLNSVMANWLATGPYEQVGDDSVQVFDERFKGGDKPDSEIDFWIPVKPRAK